MGIPGTLIAIELHGLGSVSDNRRDYDLTADPRLDRGDIHSRRHTRRPVCRCSRLRPVQGNLQTGRRRFESLGLHGGGREVFHNRRIHSIARYEERDGGVYFELEAIALTRDIPASLAWMVKPVVNHLSINSLTTTLRQTRDAVISQTARPERIASCVDRDPRTGLPKSGAEEVGNSRDATECAIGVPRCFATARGTDCAHHRLLGTELLKRAGDSETVRQTNRPGALSAARASVPRRKCRSKVSTKKLV